MSVVSLISRCRCALSLHVRTGTSTMGRVRVPEEVAEPKIVTDKLTVCSGGCFMIGEIATIHEAT